MCITTSDYPPVRRRVPTPVTEDIPGDTSRREHPTSTPYGLKRVAGAIGKQISVLKATIAKFKRIRPSPRRDPISSTKEATSPQTADRPLLAGQSKTTKGPLLPASCFQSTEGDPEIEKDRLKAMGREAQLLSGPEVQVKQSFSTGLGPVSENDVVRRAPRKATREARLPSVLRLYDECHY